MCNAEKMELIEDKIEKANIIELIEDKYDQLYRIAYSYLQNDHDVFDALQDSFIKAYTNINKLRKSEYFSTWYIKILINTCKQILKYKKKIKSFEHEEHTERYVDIKHIDTTIDINNCICRLAVKKREVVYLHYFEDMPISLISQLLKIPIGTVKSRLYYGVLDLARYLNEKEEKYNEM